MVVIKGFVDRWFQLSLMKLWDFKVILGLINCFCSSSSCPLHIFEVLFFYLLSLFPLYFFTPDFSVFSVSHLFSNPFNSHFFYSSHSTSVANASQFPLILLLLLFLISHSLSHIQYTHFFSLSPIPTLQCWCLCFTQKKGKVKLG